MRRESGFTLIELLVVIAIIFILLSIAVPNYINARRKATEVQCKANLRTLGQGLFHYKLDYNLYWRTDGKPVEFAGMSMDEWRKRGQDIHSLVADPLFVAPERGDFHLKTG